MRIAHSRRVALAAGLATVALLGAGCSSGSRETANQPGSQSANQSANQSAEGAAAMPGLATPSSTTLETTASAGAPFGPACPTVPATGAGSFESMAKDPVATATSNNPGLSKLTEAISAAGLKDTLNSAEAVTVLAPTNEAFAAADKEAISKAMADPKGQLTDILNYHIVQGRLAPDQLVGEHKTLQGTKVTITGGGEAFLVNDASVVCGNIQTANGTVYLIDKVLMPKA